MQIVSQIPVRFRSGKPFLFRSATNSMANSKSRLGRGLSGLITGGIGSQSSGDSKPPSKPVSGKPSKKPVQPKKTAAKKRSAPPAPELPGYAEIPVGKIDQNPFQPRREFDAEQLRELAESIRSEGLLQPIVVRKSGG